MPDSRDVASRSASVKDVAQRAGVSLGTVSNVLNRPDRVSAATRERVEKAMTELGFVRNESARQLRAGRSRTIGYVMLDATNPFFTDVAQGMELVAEDRDLSLFLCNSDNRANREATHLAHLQEQRVQGILVTPVDPDSPALADLASRGTPLVIVDRTRPGASFCTVSVDDVLGGRLAVEHLADRGHRRVAFVGGPDTLGQVRERLEGARLAWQEAGLPDADLVVVPTTALSVAEGRAAGERLAGPSRTQAPDRGVLRQRPHRPGPAPAGHVLRRTGARRPGHRGVRRHRLRGGRRRSAHLGAPAPRRARPHRRSAPAGRGGRSDARARAGRLRARARRPALDPGLKARRTTHDVGRRCERCCSPALLRAVRQPQSGGPRT